jgi:ABC-2 type transport system permease protein
MGLLTAELRKLTTVRTTWILTALGVALIVLSVATFTLGELMGAPFDPFTGSSSDVADAIDQIGSNSLIVLVVALLAITTEFRHGTIGRSLQLTPSRTRVLVAKLAAGVLYSVVFFLVGLLIVAPMVALAATINDVGVSFGPEVADALWQGPLGLALTAMLGVAVGALLRSQVVAITLSLVWLFLVENLVNAIWPEIARWLPFQALNAIFLPEDAVAMAPEGMVTPLEPVVALSVFLAYVVVATAVAALLLRTRDV